MLLDLPLGLLLVLGGLGRAHEEAEQSLQTIVSSVSDSATRWMVYLEGSIVEQEQEQEQESIEGPNLAGWT